MITNLHLAVYGNTEVWRGFCTQCKRMALIVENEIQCCDAQVVIPDQPPRRKRMSIAENQRRRLKKRQRQACLEDQHYRCLYCEQSFGSIVWYKSKQITLKIVWDHQTPFAFSQDNRECNFVAACHICNAWKSALIFQSVDEVKIYVQQKWETHGKAPPDLP